MAEKKGGSVKVGNSNVREVVLDLLLELSDRKEYSSVLIAEVLNKYDYLDGKQKAFIKRVGEGVIERRIQLDYVLDQYSKTPVIKMKPLIRELLRLSAYQLLFMEHIPESAVCNEAVKLAKKRGFQSLQGFVNGVLRNIARGKSEIVWPDGEKNQTERLSVLYSMPPWLVELFIKNYGIEVCEKILAAFLESGTVGVRLDERLSNEEREALLAAWRASGVRAVRHPYLPYAATLRGASGIRSLEGYQEGKFAVQDASSMLAVEAAGIRPGDHVLDVCAAPGGKALHAATKLGGKGEVIACDVSRHKADKIEENRSRLRLGNVSVRVQDARENDTSLVGWADVLLADLPCSGLGVIGHKQDIKYRVTEESLEEVQVLQKDIITNVIEYIKPGGTMLYSTCTMNPLENERMAAWICETFGFEPASMAESLPSLFAEEAKRGTLQLLPGVHKTDGFFIAKLRKKV